MKIAGFSASDKQRDKRNSADEYPKRYSAYQGLGHMSYASCYYAKVLVDVSWVRPEVTRVLDESSCYEVRRQFISQEIDEIIPQCRAI